jgi:hypothetical protein
MKAKLSMIANLKRLSRVCKRIMGIFFTSMLIAWLCSCVDDLGFSGFNLPPEQPVPFFNPGKLVADSVSYLSTDSIVLYGHFKPDRSRISVVGYYFRVNSMPALELLIVKDKEWEFASLDTVIISSIKIRGVPASTTFNMTLEVKNPHYNPATDPIGSKTNYFVSNAVAIKPIGSY